jgi:molecular chaperone Hsp33
MENSDFLIRGIIKPLKARFSFAETTSTVSRGILLHNTDPVSAYIFGRALTVAALSSPLLNEDEKYSLRWDYEGKLSTLVVDTDSECNVRGIPKEPNLMAIAETEEDVYGNEGKITLIKSKNGKILNSGTGKTALMDIVEDAAFFFSVSDQIETEMSVGISFNKDPENPVNICAGFMLQAMPECDLEEFEKVREELNKTTFYNILESKKIQEEKKLWKLLEILKGNQKGFSYDKINEYASYEFASTPSYTCQCSQEKMKQAVKVLEEKDIEDIFKEKDELKIKCEFCKQEYSFKKSDFSV